MAGLATKIFERGLFIALHAYLLASSYAIFYEFGRALWKRGIDDFGLQPSYRSTHVWAGLIWGVLGVVRLVWVSAWITARLRSVRTKIRVVGRRIAMQSDLYTIMGRGRPQRIRDRSGRPRFCKYQHTSTGCFDGGRPLGDRVYHCKYVAKKSDRDQKMRGIHLPVYDHYCSWIGVIVYLDTIKAYLLTLIFLFLDALVVFACSVAGLCLFQHTVMYAAVMVLAAIIVLGLGSHNAWRKSRHLAMRNITLPEMYQLGRIAGVVRGFLWFRISLDRDSGEFLDARFTGQNSNPWDLGTRRNLYQVFGGWDCLLPWTQPPRSADYGNPKHEFDFEMSDEFRHWVEERRAELRSRTAGSQPAVVPLDRREEAQSRGPPPAPPQLTPPSSPPLNFPPLSPRQTPRLSPVVE